MTSKRLYPYCQRKIDFLFVQNKYDFIVEEIPSEAFSETGSFLVLKIKKTYMSTWELLKHISVTFQIEEHKIGYAGLKDKNATTTQYISIPLIKEKYIQQLNNKQVRVLETHRHNKKINIGDLKGNHFKINLSNIQDEDIFELYRILSKIQKHGMPNYFGFQRFGADFDFEYAKSVAYGEEIVSKKNLSKLIVSAYQSYYFNCWLSERIKPTIKEEFNSLQELDGDIYSKETGVVTGLLPGRKIIRSKNEAREIEAKYDDEYVQEKGFRRDAWIKPSEITNAYDKKTQTLSLSFTLPKSSYATVLIENLAMKNFSLKDTAKKNKK